METPENRNLVSKVIEIFQRLFRKLSKMFDRIVFEKRGSLLISLVLAIMFSLSTNYENLSLQLFKDKTTSTTINNVKVETLIDSENYVVEGIPNRVDVTLIGDAPDLQIFRQQKDLKVIADVRKFEEGPVVVDLFVSQLPTNLKASTEPASIEAMMFKKVVKRFAVRPDLLVGPGQKQSDFDTPVLAENTVAIKASQEELNSIRTVKAIVDATGQTTAFETDANLVAYDSSGNRVQVDIEPAKVHARVELAKKDEK